MGSCLGLQSTAGVVVTETSQENTNLADDFAEFWRFGVVGPQLLWNAYVRHGERVAGDVGVGRVNAGVGGGEAAVK